MIAEFDIYGIFVPALMIFAIIAFLLAFVVRRFLDIIGFYHSHPDHPARWSPTDFQEAHWIGCSYVITSVEHGRAAQTNSFALTGTTEENKALLDEPIVVQ